MMNLIDHFSQRTKAVCLKYRQVFTLIVLLELISCTSGSSNIGSIPSDFDSKVLIQNSSQLEMLIEKKDVADLVGISEDKIRAFYEDFDERVSEHFLLFSWATNKSVSLGTREEKLEIPAFSSMGFGRISQISQSAFEEKYQAKTAESVKASIVAMTSDETIDSDEAIWEAKEVVRNAKTQRVERLENSGTVAYWETPINVLHAWVDGVEISVSSTVDEDSNLNKKKAIELLGLVLQSPTN